MEIHSFIIELCDDFLLSYLCFVFVSDAEMGKQNSDVVCIFLLNYSVIFTMLQCTTFR